MRPKGPDQPDMSAIRMLTELGTQPARSTDGHADVPPRHKVAFVVWTAMFPTVLFLSTLLAWLPFEMPLVLSVFVITAVTVPTAVYILLPRLCRLFDPWVRRESKGGTDRETRAPSSTEQGIEGAQRGSDG